MWLLLYVCDFSLFVFESFWISWPGVGETLLLQHCRLVCFLFVFLCLVAFWDDCFMFISSSVPQEPTTNYDSTPWRASRMGVPTSSHFGVEETFLLSKIIIHVWFCSLRRIIKFTIHFFLNWAYFGSMGSLYTYTRLTFLNTQPHEYFFALIRSRDLCTPSTLNNGR